MTCLANIWTKMNNEREKSLPISGQVVPEEELEFGQKQYRKSSLKSGSVAACRQIFAVHSRYTVFNSFRFLQGHGERPAFTAVTRVQIPSGTPNLFSNLRFPLLLYIGTKKEQLSASTRMHFIEAAVFSHRSRHFEQAQIRNTSQQTGLNQQPL